LRMTWRVTTIHETTPRIVHANQERRRQYRARSALPARGDAN
jgi:hypothetical protein